jgi:biotin carboxylase
LLVVGAGPFQLELVRAAGQIAELVAVDGSSRAPGLALVDHARVVDVRDVQAVVAVAREFGVQGVLTAASDVCVPAVSAVVQALGLAGLTEAAAERCRDKLQAFERVHAAGLAVPETYAVEDVAQAQAAVAALGGHPVVVKPRSGGGGRGVSIVRDAGALAPALARARASYAGTARPGVLVQRCIAGRSIGAEAFFVDSRLRALFLLDDQFEPGFVSPAGHSLPPQLDPALAAAVEDAVQAFGAALELTSGAANFDLRHAGERTYLLEVNPRLGGNSITDLIAHAYGVQLARAAVLCALGHDPGAALTRHASSPVAARLILRRGHGRARLTPRLHELSHPDLLALDLNVADGQRTSVQVDDWSLLGRCMVRAASPVEAVALAERIAREVADAIDIEPEAGA